MNGNFVAGMQQKGQEQELHVAIYNGEFVRVQTLLDNGVSINCIHDGISPLARALECEQRDIANLLLCHNPDMSQGNLMKNGATGSCRQQHHEPLLWLAVVRGYTDVAEKLLQSGANVNATDDFNKRTALHIAAIKSDKELVKLLLQYHAAVHCTDKHGQSPLHLAVRDNNEEITAMLIREGADVNLAGDEERLPIHIACSHGNLDVARVFIQHGAKIDIGDCFKATPLHYCATKGHAELCLLLLKHGAKAVSVDSLGEMPLHKACRLQSCPLVVETLIKHGPTNPNVEGGPDTLRKLPLQMAAAEGHLGIVKKLLELGADLNLRDIRCNETALHWAIRRQQLHVIDYLLDEGINIHDINEPDGCTALHLTCIFDNCGSLAKTAQRLVQLGINTGHICQSEGQTAIHMAAARGSYPLMKAFIDEGVDLNVVNKHGNTPLVMALLQKHMTVVNLLLENDCSVNMVNRDGETCLHVAIRLGLYDLATKLVQGGCSATLRNLQGDSPLTLTSHLPISLYTVVKDDSRLLLIMTLFAAGASSKSLFLRGRSNALGMVRVRNRQLYNLAMQYAILKQTRERDPLPLFECSALQVRKYLSDYGDGALIFKLLDRLPLPKSIKEHLLLRDLEWRSVVL